MHKRLWVFIKMNEKFDLSHMRRIERKQNKFSSTESDNEWQKLEFSFAEPIADDAIRVARS